MKDDTIFRVSFVCDEIIYEVYTREVSESAMFGFIEIGELLFGEQNAVVVDPSEERLKQEFEGVVTSYIPMHSIIRIDEVAKEGVAKIRPLEKGEGKVSPFPGARYKPGNQTKES